MRLHIAGSLFKLVVAAVIAICAPSLAAQEAPRHGTAAWDYLAGIAREKRLEVIGREARREGALTIYGAMGIDRFEIVRKTFNEKYPDVKVNFVRLTEPEATDKVLLEYRTGRVSHDLIISTVTWTDLLAEAFAPYEPTNWNDFDRRFRLGSRQDGWVAVVFELFASTIAWRTDRVKTEEVPKTLFELADPKWKGRTGVTLHLENLMNGLLLQLGEDKGMDLIRRLAALNNRLYKSHGAFAQGLAAGEFDIGWDFLANRAIGLKAKGAPVDFVFQEPLLGIGAIVAATKSAQNPYSAALFIEHMTQPEFLEVFDRTEPGRMFGHVKGNFTTKLNEYPNLSRYSPISPARFKELNQLADKLFIR